MPKFTKIERPSTPREAYELLRSSKTACVMGGAGCGCVFSIAPSRAPSICPLAAWTR